MAGNISSRMTFVFDMGSWFMVHGSGIWLIFSPEFDPIKMAKGKATH